jgi:hypothetical protein
MIGTGRMSLTKVSLGPIVACENGLLSDFRPLHHSQELHPCLLHPNPARRLTAEQALSHTWLMNFAAPTAYDLCGRRENFDPRDRGGVGHVALCEGQWREQ